MNGAARGREGRRKSGLVGDTRGEKNEWEYDGVIGMEPNKKEGGWWVGRQASDEKDLPSFALPTYLSTTQAYSTQQRRMDISDSMISKAALLPGPATQYDRP